MLKYVFLLLIFIFTLSCKKPFSDKEKKEENKLNEIVFLIDGVVKDTMKIPNIKLYKYLPVITYTENTVPYIEHTIVKNNSSKKNIIKIKNVDEIYVKHHYRLDDFYYFFKKGDSILYSDNNGFPIYKVLNSKNIDLSYEQEKRKHFNLKEPKSFFYFQLSKLMMSQNKEKSIEQYCKNVLLNFNLEQNFLDSLYSQKKLSKRFYLFQKEKIKFDFYNLTIQAKGREFYKKNKIELRNELKKDSLIKYSFFKEFVEKTAYYESVINDNIEKNKAPKIISQYKFALNSDLILPKTKNYLLHTLIQQISENLSLKDFETAYELFTKNTTSKVLVDDISNKYLVNYSELKKEIDSVHLISLDKTTTTLSEVIKKNKGKIIYVDFWASWCSPCIKEFPALKKLSKDFINKDVVFLYISLDSNYNEWKKASQDLSLDLNKNSFLAINYPKANFYKNLILKDIPRYIIFNKEGKLLHKKAPKPSSKKIKKLLENEIQ